MNETSLLAPEDKIIKARIADRANSNKIRDLRHVESKYLQSLISQFGSFKKFIEKVDFDIDCGLVYDRDERTKTCTICGEMMPIHAMLSAHRKHCGVYKVFENGVLIRK